MLIPLFLRGFNVRVLLIFRDGAPTIFFAKSLHLSLTEIAFLGQKRLAHSGASYHPGTQDMSVLLQQLETLSPFALLIHWPSQLSDFGKRGIDPPASCDGLASIAHSNASTPFVTSSTGFKTLSRILNCLT